MRYFRLASTWVETQQRGWLQDDGGTQNAYRVHEKGAQTGDETLAGAQVVSTFAGCVALRYLKQWQKEIIRNSRRSE